MLLNSHKILTTGNRPRPRVRLATGVYARDELSFLGRQLRGYRNRCRLFSESSASFGTAWSV
jgi:hypothetical protein